VQRRQADKDEGPLPCFGGRTPYGSAQEKDGAHPDAADPAGRGDDQLVPAGTSLSLGPFRGMKRFRWLQWLPCVRRTGWRGHGNRTLLTTLRAGSRSPGKTERDCKRKAAPTPHSDHAPHWAILEIADPIVLVPAPLTFVRRGADRVIGVEATFGT